MYSSSLKILIALTASLGFHGGLVTALSMLPEEEKIFEEEVIQIASLEKYEEITEVPKTIIKEEKKQEEAPPKKTEVKKTKLAPKPVIKEVIKASDEPQKDQERFAEENLKTPDHLLAKEEVIEREVQSDLASKQQEAMIRYENLVINQIAKNKRYPRLAKQRGIEGAGSIQISIFNDGSLKASRVLQAIEDRSLNEEMLEMVKRSGRFPPFPEIINKPEIVLKIPIKFYLE